jgi:NTE family protein
MSGGKAVASAQLPAIAPQRRRSIGLVLEGGGALGLAHIGVLQWFEQNHIPVDRIAGTSMGALVGGLYASGRSANNLREIATSDVFSGMFAVQTAYTDVDYRRRQDRRDLPQAISFGLKSGVSFRNAVLTDTGLNAFLLDAFAAYNREGIAFDQLPIPFRCVATDLNTLEPVVFDGGSMPQAIRASISIPGIFSPVSYHGHYLVDGAIMDNLPTDVAKMSFTLTSSSQYISKHLPSQRATSTPFWEYSPARSRLGLLVPSVLASGWQMFW